jgi:endonuclease/exonuclease/phosphatase family metal-dependent hydrolase
MGDFNATPESEEVGLALRELTDAAPASLAGYGTFTYFGDGDAGPECPRIDYCFARGLRITSFVVDSNVRTDGSGRRASDHRPRGCELGVP